MRNRRRASHTYRARPAYRDKTPLVDINHHLAQPWFNRCGILPFGSGNPQDTLPKPAYAQNGMELLWGPDIKQKALQMIRASRREVHLDIYELSDSDILQALADAHRRGVDVRVVVDSTEPHSTTIAVPALQKDGIPVEQIQIKQGIDHVKMLIVDNNVLLGGMNYGQASWNNNDASVYIPGQSQRFEELFEWDFARASGQVVETPSFPQPLLVDRRIGEAVVDAIGQARREIDLEAFDLSDADVIAALHSALARGVQVSVLVDPSQTYNRKAVSELQSAGALIRYYRPYQGELMHAKILDVDGGRVFIIGSANFSRQAYTYNHEADLWLTNVPFSQALTGDLHAQLARGTNYPMTEKEKQWDES
ncbi:phospholipase D-like domain-containing protein [Alicyclobacillus sacchari]|uniref:phospholipase D-like domain-containing protein n=1 Tax=Alicyclobacillus sacchari TaxID=392010 RepID=UPI0024E05326|nr:phospholipase D-like domain-containing protein [Alicyclobacillus sacchari]